MLTLFFFKKKKKETHVAIISYSSLNSQNHLLDPDNKKKPHFESQFEFAVICPSIWLV